MSATISVDWPSKVINVPKGYLTLLSGILYEMDIPTFHLDLKDLEDDIEGMPWPDTHTNIPPVTVGGTQLARIVEIINGYTITFEDGQYSVNVTGANSNIADVVNRNQVSVNTANSAGLVASATINRIERILANKAITDPVAGKFRVYDDDGVAVLYEADLWEDAAGTIPYRGKGAERKERLE